MKRLYLLILVVLVIPTFLFSKPVKVDEILTAKKQFELDTAIYYSNISRKDGASYPLQYQTQNGDFLTVPTYAGDSKMNQNYINYALSLRYGATEDLDFFASVNYYTSTIHFSSGENFSTDSEQGFNSLNLGFNYNVKQENDTPSLLVGASVTTFEKVELSNTTKNFAFKGYTFFAVSYYTVDPVVFLLKSSYRLSLKQKYKNNSIDNGEMFTLSPQIHFAVNPYTSISWGVQYSYNSQSEIDDIIVSGNTSSVSYLFGTSYELNKKIILNLDVDFSNNEAVSQNNLGLTVSYKF